ncbi:SDR family NAD(P)-dependent oxidoreductase [Streptacidiphilus griseoplanus]|uniref:SDR family NAD(P)-dependent oxidoreductase n=1 Tax=Peterkaempfera griseoplana TaxID=66896 RepID=UPI0006E3F96C|nr:SDR family NAD(P)-dependent oxidoreductase [Peterkaempfera griseoplana]
MNGRRTQESPLAGQTAVVTGASRGLGLLIARELADRGCALVVCARDAEALHRSAEQLRSRGAPVTEVAADLTDPETADRLVAAARSSGREVDILVNNAGEIQVGPVAAMTEADFRSAMETMFFAPLRLVLAVVPGMRERRRGRVVNVTSIGGRIAAPHLLPYDAAKFAAAGLSEGLRAELAADGVSVTTVVPGLMRTGSHLAAEFAGRPEQEYAWFGPAASLPGLSMDAGRAARRIVRAAERRRAELVLTPVAKIAVRAHGIAPATTTRTLGLAARLLPGEGGDGGDRARGAEAARRLGSRLVGVLTTAGDRAARRHNEPA